MEPDQGDRPLWNLREGGLPWEEFFGGRGSGEALGRGKNGDSYSSRPRAASSRRGRGHSISAVWARSAGTNRNVRGLHFKRLRSRIHSCTRSRGYPGTSFLGMMANASTHSRFRHAGITRALSGRTIPRALELREAARVATAAHRSFGAARQHASELAQSPLQKAPVPQAVPFTELAQAVRNTPCPATARHMKLLTGNPASPPRFRGTTSPARKRVLVRNPAEVGSVKTSTTFSTRFTTQYSGTAAPA